MQPTLKIKGLDLHAHSIDFKYLTDDHKGHAIEHGTQVGEAPEQNTELDRVDEIFNKE